MAALVEQGMKDGAFGLSTGLFYVPGTFTPTDEVIELAKVAGRFGGIHKSHQRDDAAKVLDSVQRDDRDRREGRPADADQPRTRSSARRTGAGASTRCGSSTRRARAAWT